MMMQKINRITDASALRGVVAAYQYESEDETDV